MSRRTALVVGALAVALLAVLLVWLLRPARPAPEEEAAAPQPLPAAEGAGEGAVEVELYFPGEWGRLYPERRLLPPAADPATRARALAEAVLAGPETPGLFPPLPEAIQLDEVYLEPDGTLLLGLRSPDEAPPPPGGSLKEMLTVYSLVDSLLLNLPEATRMVLLWNGRQPATFAGHLDTALPLSVDPTFIAR